MDTIAFIHAKGTSERLPGKNLLALGGEPLVCHAIRAAKRARLVHHVVVDSDSDRILEIAVEMGVEPWRRPKELATNQTTGNDLAVRQAEHVDTDVIVQVVPTSPFIRPETIDMALALLVEDSVDSVVGMRRERLYRWEENSYELHPVYYADGQLPNSSDLPWTAWETTGLYVMRRSFVLQHERRVNTQSWRPWWLSAVEAIDINTEEDIEFARIVWLGARA